MERHERNCQANFEIGEMSRCQKKKVNDTQKIVLDC